MLIHFELVNFRNLKPTCVANMWIRFLNSYWMVLLKMSVLWIWKIPLWNIPKYIEHIPNTCQKYIQIYPRYTKIYKDIPRSTKYQAAAGPPRPAWPRGASPGPACGVSGPGRAGRPRRYLGYIRIYFDIRYMFGICFYIFYIFWHIPNGVFRKFMGRLRQIHVVFCDVSHQVCLGSQLCCESTVC